MWKCVDEKHRAFRVPVAGRVLWRAAADPLQGHTVPPIVHDVLRSPGQPLDPATRAWSHASGTILAACQRMG